MFEVPAHPSFGVFSGAVRRNEEDNARRTSQIDPLLTLQTLMHCKRLTKARGPLLLRVAFALRNLWNGSQRSSVAAPLWHRRCALFEPLCF